MLALTGLGAPAMKFQPSCIGFILTLCQARNNNYYNLACKKIGRHGLLHVSIASTPNLACHCRETAWSHEISGIDTALCTISSNDSSLFVIANRLARTEISG